MPNNPFTPPKADLTPPTEVAEAPPMWNPDAAGLWSLLFTPVFGSTLVMKNWRALGEDGRARSALYWLIASVFMLVVSFAGGIGLLWIIIWYFAAQRPQAQYIKERWGKDYPKRGWGIPLLIAVGAVIGVWLLLTVILLLTGYTPRGAR
jgi:heme/copper-type cytochrome/quinol oxidase subunit 2